MNPYKQSPRHMTYARELPEAVVTAIHDYMSEWGNWDQHRYALEGAWAILVNREPLHHYALTSKRDWTEWHNYHIGCHHQIRDEMVGVAIALSHLGWSRKGIRAALHLPSDFARLLPI